MNLFQSNKLPDRSTSQRDIDVIHSIPENIEIPIFSKYYNNINQHDTTDFSEKQSEIKREKLIALTMCKRVKILIFHKLVLPQLL